MIDVNAVLVAPDGRRIGATFTIDANDRQEAVDWIREAVLSGQWAVDSDYWTVPR